MVSTKIGVTSSTARNALLVASLAWSAMMVKEHLIPLEEELAAVRLRMNNTVRSNQSFLIFNRTPKSGSQTLWSLLNILAERNGFLSASDSAEAKMARGSENTFLHTLEMRLQYLDLWDQPNSTFSYSKHINFFDFTEFGRTNPIYINVVRNPIERVVSWYYYRRAPWYLVEGGHQDGSKGAASPLELKLGHISLNQLKTSYEDCVTQGRPECTYLAGMSYLSDAKGGSHVSQVSFFCGMKPVCAEFESPEALSLAKRNVDEFYAVVAVLENMDESIPVLEAYVPRFFQGAAEAYATFRRKLKQNRNLNGENQNIYKPKVAEDFKRKWVYPNFTNELEFYHFCRQRLHKQYLLIQR